MTDARAKPFLAAASLLVGVIAAAVAAAGPAAPAPRGSILISSTRDPALHDELWLLDVRTGRRTNVSRSPAADREPALAPGGRAVAFVSDRGGAEALYVSEPDGRGLRRLAGPFPEVSGRFVQIHQPRWSPDGRRLAFVTLSPSRGATTVEVRVIAREGGASIRIARSSQLVWSVHWAPDSRRVAVASLDAKGYRTSVYDLRGRRSWTVAGQVAAWSARGELALLYAPRMTIAVAGPDGKVRRRTTGSQAFWSPDGRLLAVADDRSLRVLDQRGRIRVRAARTSFGYGGSPWFPDGRALLVTDDQGRIFRLTLDGKRSAFARSGSYFAWSPDGALASFDGRAIAVYRGASTRTYPLGIAQGLCESGGLGPAPAWVDRDHLVYAAGRGGQNTGDLWVVAAGRLRRLPGSARGWRAAPVWSPNGSSIAYEQGDAHTHGGGCSGPYLPQIRVADANGGNVRALTEARRNFDRDPRWSPDGRSVAFSRSTLDDLSKFGILVVDLQTRTERRLTSGDDSIPTWTADGRAIVHQRNRQIRRVEIADGAVTTIGAGELPQAAPRGTLVAFLRNGALWTMEADGSNARRLGAVKRAARPPINTGEVDPPRWAPDGRRLALADASGILVFPIGGGVTRIAAPGAGGIAWSADGRTLSFHAPAGNYSRGGFSSQYVARTELYTVPASGGRPRRVTTDLANVVGAAAWRP